MRYNCKKILNNIKSVLPHPDLEKIVKKDLTIAKQKVNNKHYAIMTGIATGIINEETGFKQMMMVYEEVDNLLSMWIDQVNNMIEFLEDVKEYHGFVDYMKLDADQQKMFDHIHKEILKYQRLNAEIMGLSVYIDTLMGEYGLLEEFLEGIGEDPDEDENEEDLDADEVEEKEAHFSSWKWLYGRKLDFQYELSHRFAWGGITMQFQVDAGKIKDVEVYSDALNIELAEAIPKFLKGIKYRKETMCVQLGLFWSKDENVENMMNDVIAWIQETDL